MARHAEREPAIFIECNVEELMSGYIVRLFDRTLRILRDGRKLQFANRSDALPYRTVQAAADEALLLIARDANADGEKAIVAALDSVPVSIEGHRREIDVFAFHWHIAHGVPLETVGRIARIEADRGASIYEDFQFGSQSSRIRAINAYYHEWSELREQCGPAKAKAPRHSRLANDRPRVGVVGHTGAGKSMFINALLRRDLLSSSAGNSTACITELRYVDRPDRERIQVTPVSAEKLQGELKNGSRWRHRLRVETGSSQSAADRRLEGLKQAMMLRDGAVLPLAELSRLTNVEVSPIAHGVERVVAYVNAPLLEKVTLVDTPGTHDPDEHRRRLAILEAPTLDAWVYLTRADQAPFDTVTSDWDEFRKVANNRSALAILTMADKLPQQEMSRTIEARRADYRSLGWENEITPAAARPVLDVIIHGVTDDTVSLIGQFVVRTQPQAPANYARTVRRRLEDVADAHTVASQVIVDYLTDAFGLVEAGQQMSELSQRAALSAADHTREELLKNLDATMSELETELATHRTALKNAEDASAHERSLLEQRGACQDAESDLRSAEEALDEAMTGTEGVIRRVLEVVRDGTSRLVPTKADHDRWVQAHGQPHYLWGTTKFDVLGQYEVPSAKLASAVVETELGALSTKILDATSAAKRGPLEKTLQNKLTELTSNYTLLSRHYAAEEPEALFESSSTTRARLYQKTLETCAHIQSDLERATATRLKAGAKELGSVARAEAIQPLVDALASRKALIEETQHQIEWLKRGAKFSSDALVEKIARLVDLVTSITQLRARVEAEFVATESIAA